MSQPYLMSLLFVLGLLGAGFALRAGLRPLRTLFVPASVVGGLVGLCVMQAGLRVGPGELIRVGQVTRFQTPEGAIELPPPFLPLPNGIAQTQRLALQVANTIDGWPGLLIAVVFAGLLIERPGKTFREAMVRASRQGVVAWIIILGEVFVGLLAVALLVRPFYPELAPAVRAAHRNRLRRRPRHGGGDGQLVHRHLRL